MITQIKNSINDKIKEIKTITKTSKTSHIKYNIGLLSGLEFALNTIELVELENDRTN